MALPMLVSPWVRFSRKFSVPSLPALSPWIWTVTVLVVSPGWKVRLPLVAA